VERLTLLADTADAFQLDARLRAAVRALQRIDFQTGRLLRLVAQLRLHRAFGVRAFPDYVRERLGCSLRNVKTWGVAEPEVGVIYTGKVVKIMDFGAFVNFLGARDGLVHISELAPQRVAKTGDIVKVGDQVKVKVLGFDDRGKVKLSMKQVDQATGEDISAKLDQERRERHRDGKEQAAS